MRGSIDASWASRSPWRASRQTDFLTALEVLLSVRVTEIEPLAVSVSSAAKLLGVSRDQVYRLARSGELGSALIGESNGRRVIPVEALRQYIAAHMTAAATDESAHPPT